jgi:dihydrofolate reductase
MTTRTVIAWVNMSIDGFTAGPNRDTSCLFSHINNDRMTAYSRTIWRRATTAVMGRVVYDCYRRYWPVVAADPHVAPGDRAFGQWLDGVDKVVVSRTLTEAPWVNSRVETDLEDTVRRLRTVPGGDIVVCHSASVIRALLTAGLVDELCLTLLPEVLGEGLRLFTGPLPRSGWTLAGTTTLDTGAVGLRFARR